MNASTGISYERPAHVPAERVFDFDMFYDPRIERDVHDGHLQLLDDAPDIFWTPRNAGHWVATRHADVTTVLKNPAVFSSVNAPFERTQPAMDLPVPPMDMDAPEHRPHRRRWTGAGTGRSELGASKVQSFIGIGLPRTIT